MGSTAPDAPNREEPPHQSGPFPRRFRGYDRMYVDHAIAERDAYADRLRAQVNEAVARIRHLENTAALQAAELKLWHERREFVDQELRRVRTEADNIEAAARQRAATLEEDAQRRASQLVERVYSEASSILDAARSEAQTTHERYETEVERARRKVDRLTDLQGQMTRTVRTAMQDLEHAFGQLERARPTRIPEPSPDLPTTTIDTSGSVSDPALATLRVMESGARPSTPRSGNRTIEVSNVDSYSELAGFERQLASAPGVTRVFLTDFDGDVARLEVSVDSDVGDLTSQLEHSMGVPLKVESSGDSTLRVELAH